jgi:hypothetical protein
MQQAKLELLKKQSHGKDNLDNNDCSVESGNYLSTSISNTSTPILEDRFGINNLQNFRSFESKENEVSIGDNDDFLKTIELSYDNLNDCVASLLKKAKGENGSSRDIKRRLRKNRD